MQRYIDYINDNTRWESFAFRPGDVVISTPAKCGTTWMQRLVSLVLGVEPTPERTMAMISPWLDMRTRPLEEVLAVFEDQDHRRFVKTHTPLDGLPFDERAVYITCGRDPRDVAVSWSNHMHNMDLAKVAAARQAADVPRHPEDDEAAGRSREPDPPADPIDRFWYWLDEGRMARLVNHVATFWEQRHLPNVHLFHYADLQRDLPGEVSRLAEALAVELDDARVATIAEQASFASMRSRATELAPSTDNDIWRDTQAFFNRGSSGQWSDLLSSDDLARYEATIATYEPAEVVRWLHSGGPAVEPTQAYRSEVDRGGTP